jgi:hypothetical protein
VTVHAGKPTGAAGTLGADGFSNFSEGEIPIGSLIEDNQIPPLEIPGFLCACVRARSLKTCGGRPPVPGGDVATCADDSACANESCEFTHGEGAFSSGVIGCKGLADVDYTLTIDGQVPEDDPGKVVFERSGGMGPQGSAFLYATTAIATIVGDCGFHPESFAYGIDGLPCTDDDPSQGVAVTVPQTTGSATSTVKTTDGSMVTCAPEGDPVRAVGSPVSCDNLPSTVGFAVAQAFAVEDQPTVGDTAVCSTFRSIDPGL